MTSSSPSDPSLQSLLARNPELNGHELAILLRDDQSRRWGRGERLLVEHYQIIVPRLAGQPEALLDLIYSEFLLREGLGDAPKLAEYAERFPHLAEHLRWQFALHHELLPMATGGTVPPCVAVNAHLTLDQSPEQQARAREASGERPGAVSVPGYEILGELGRGGMGVVYKATQVRAGRAVALKMMLAGGHAGPEELARFRTEAEAVARLQHPGVVQIFEVGEHRGLPFFSMEFCEGGSLKDRLDDEPLAPREAAVLVEKLAAAVESAHRAGVIHRDLKPANVLLAGDGTPKVTDFGMAKKLDQAGLTATGAVVGTPSYMAPEQARGESRGAGPATDVYALGAVLYECLTGRPPFLGPTMMVTLLQVLHQEPVPVRQLQPNMSRDLETICLKCLAKEPAKRYGSAAALAKDLRCFRAGEPIAARPAGAWERGWRWCRRNPAVAGLLGAVLAVLLLGTATSTGFGLYAQTQAGQAELDKQAAQKSEANAREEEQRANARRREKEEQLAFSKVALAAGAWRDGQGEMTQDRLDEVPADLRNWEWHHLKLQSQGIFTLYGHTDTVNSVAYSPDGTRLATAGDDKTARIWDARTGRELFALNGHTGPLWGVAVSPDGTRLATGGADQTAKVWDMGCGRELLTLGGHTDSVSAVAYSPDGTRLATASWDQTARVWDARTGRELLTLKGHTNSVWTVAYSPDGTRLATASDDRTARVWDALTGRGLLTLRGHTDVVRDVAYSPDGTRLATASWDQTARVWDARTGRELFAPKGHTNVVTRVVFSPDGARLATASSDQTARVWDTGSGWEKFTLRGHTDSVLSVAYSPDGARLATASSDQTARVWDARTGRELFALERHTDSVCSVAYSPDGTRLATASDDQTARVWDAASGRELLTLKGHSDVVNDVAYSPDGARLATASSDQTARVWDAASGREILTLKGHTRGVTGVAYSPDGTRLATASFDNTARVWDAASGQELMTLKGHIGSWLFDVAYSPDGTRLATTGNDRTARVWDPGSGRELLALRGHTGDVTEVAYSPDGTRLATTGNDRTARVWDAASGQELLTLKGHTDFVYGVAYSPDGTRLATAGRDDAAKVWDAASGREILTLKGHTDVVTEVAYSPDGTRLATASYDRTARVWDARTGRELLAFQGHSDVVRDLAYSPDGTRLATASDDQTARVWDAASGRELLAFQGHTDVVYGVAYSPDGTRLATASYDRTARVWDARTGRELLTLTGHTDEVTGVAFSPEGQQVIGTAFGGKTLVWDAQTGQVVPDANIPPIRPAAVSPDGQILALPSGTMVRLISLRDPDPWELGARMWITRLDPLWHAEQAKSHRQDRNHEAAAFHLEQLLGAFPSRGEHVSTLLSVWNEAVGQHPDRARAWRHLALVQLFAVQPAPALQTCVTMRNRFTVPVPLCQATLGFSAAPHDALTAAAAAQLLQTPSVFGGASDFDRLLTARTGVLHPDGLPDPLLWLPAVPDFETLTRGALLCRAGKYTEAVALLQPLKEPRAHLWRALAEHGRGDLVAARRAFDDALAEMERICPSDPKADATPLPWEHRAEYEILKREVQALLKE